MDVVFTARSRHHSGGRSRGYVFSTRLVRPLGITMLPVMIGSLLGMLEGQPVLYFLYIGFPAAGSLAFIWTWIQLRRELVEIHVRSDGIAVRSAMGAAIPAETLNWRRLLDVVEQGDTITLTVGHDLYVLKTKDWPDIGRLKQHLRELMNPVARKLDMG